MNGMQQEKERHALEQLQHGRLEDAEVIYRELIEEGVISPIIFGNLATICGMQGRTQEIIPLLRKAIAINPNYPEAYNNLGNALKDQGDLQAAIDAYRKALAINANFPQAYFNLGNVLKKQGNLQAAIDAYRQALYIKPHYAEVYNNLGNVLSKQGNLSAAIDSYRQALDIKPRYAEAYFNLGNVLNKQGNLQVAIDSYRQALDIKPHYAEACFNLGNALKDQGNLQAAIDAYRQALAINPNHSGAHCNLSLAQLLSDDDENGYKGKEQHALEQLQHGHLEDAEVTYRELIEEGDVSYIIFYNLADICRRQGRTQEMIPLLKKSIEINPSSPEAYHNLGNALKKQGDLQAAINAYHQALDINSNLPDTYNNLGIALVEQENLQAAVDAYRQALAIKPHYPEAYHGLGIALGKQQNLQAAIDAFRQALAINSHYSQAYLAYFHLGIALKDQGNLQAAIDAYRQTLAINPSYLKVYINLGNSLANQGDLQAAINTFRQALAINPDYPEAHFSLSVAQLLSGDYESGWKEYEWRFRAKAVHQPHAHPQVERWNGSNLTPGESLILVSEQGLGDTLQFMRYVLYLNNTERPASLCTKTKLHDLIRVSGITTEIYSPEQANQLTIGKWLPLLSLPGYLQVRPDHPIVNTPYIKAPEQQVAHWRQKLAAEQQSIIGINWSGNLKIEKEYLRGRSLPLEAFAPIVEQTSVTLLSLQKGDGSEQLADCSFRHRFVGCQEDINQTWDFVETAAIIANCRLIITSDTAVAHLAAGMGHPTWLLLVKTPEWRWGREGERSFWYPSLRLFRQREQGNWTEVMERVAAALAAILSHPEETSRQDATG